MKKVLLYLVVTNWLYGCTFMAPDTETKSFTLNLGSTQHTEFIDFLYDYSSLNRLNISWFGWYKVSDNTYKKWYERESERSTFKVNLHLLTEENGFIYFSNSFDEAKLNYIIDYGDRKKVWVDTVDKFNKRLNEKGWGLQETSIEINHSDK